MDAIVFNSQYSSKNAMSLIGQGCSASLEESCIVSYNNTTVVWHSSKLRS